MGGASSSSIISKHEHEQSLYALERKYVNFQRKLIARHEDKINAVKTQYISYAIIGSGTCIAVTTAFCIMRGRKLSLKMKKLNRLEKEALSAKKRAEKDAATSKKFGYEKFAKSLLTISDSLDHALDPKYNVLPVSNSKEDKLTNIENIKDGIEITRRNLEKVFHEYGIEKLNPLGEKFDPTLGHEAVQTICSSKAYYPPGYINQVFQCGFKLHERDLRAATVVVVKADR
jgi:molecular chaperone GrpE